MVAIGYDRYNVIVKGFSGKKITPGMAFGILLILWSYSTGIAIGPFLGWGDYSAEGLLITCSYDFISEDLNRRTFILFAYIFNFFTPMILIVVFYSNIVRAVVAHEAALRAQAKKMNVDSLRSGAKEDEDSAEVKTASCINPIVYAVSHPKFREAMARELPCFGIGAKPKDADNKTLTDSVKTESC